MTARDPSLSSGSGEPLDDPSENVWGVYVKMLSSHNRKVAEQWKGDMSSILIFAGLFSSSLTTFLIESYRTLTPEPTEPNELLLLQLTQLVLSQTNSTIPIPLSTPSTSSNQPPTSALICNIFWFSSLAFSLICALCATMVDTWARNYLISIESRSALHKRARISAYLHQGIRIFHMNTLAELIPSLLHISLLLFFAGLVEFLRPINIAISNLVLGLLILCGSLYALVTFLPLFYTNCPYQTPLSAIWWRIFWMLGLLRSREESKPSGTILESMVHAREADATEISSERDERDLEAMRWTLSHLREDTELESFLVHIPHMISGFDYSAKLLLHQLVHDRNPIVSLRHRIPRLLGTCAEGTVIFSVASNRAMTCLQAIWSLTMMAVPLSIPFTQPSRQTLTFDEETLINIQAVKAQISVISDLADSAASVVARSLLDLFLELVATMEGELCVFIESGHWSHQRIASQKNPEWAVPRTKVLRKNIQRQLQNFEQLLVSLDHTAAPVIFMVADGLCHHLDDFIQVVVSSAHDERLLALEAREYALAFQQQLNSAGFSLTLDYISTLVGSPAAALPYEAFNTLRRLFLKINQGDSSTSFPVHLQTKLVQQLDSALEQNPKRGTWLPASIVNIVLELAGLSLKDAGCAMKAHGIVSHYVSVLPSALSLTRDTARKTIAQLDNAIPIDNRPRPISDLLSSHMYANTKLHRPHVARQIFALQPILDCIGTHLPPMGSTWSQFFPPKATFTTKDIPDLTGQVMLVTGGNSGIGKEIVKALLERNAKVYLAARNPENAKSAIADLKAETGREAEFLEVDLANLPSIKRAAQEFTSKESQLNVLFNNGGVMVIRSTIQQPFPNLFQRPPTNMLTTQGYDLQFGTNVLGHFYLTQLLLPTLISTATASAKPARIVHTSSLSTHFFPAKTFDFATFKESPKREKYGTAWLYHQSKFGNAVMSVELHRRYADKGVVSVALNPGNINTNLGRYLPGFAATLLKYLVVYPAPMGALTSLYAGTTKEGELLGGKYLFPWARLGEAPVTVHDPANGTELWKWCEEQVSGI
ncbi:hypothetical protein MIND_00524900 [Mycena indigotica]|uniref:DUF6535 domain-containing protein n=1 Tax=Mycena indigotica TaxID=2126181 RepID=A0A8H6SXS4_9AGAR|nr:uncharacterized protein MIND_00524900 [Mycena indigotica]KAF7307309.1 hypothetical protein MIND_00524900 [Mycena indigotica]